MFNITKMLEFIKNNPKVFQPESIAVKDYINEISSLKASDLDSIHSSEPVILAEILPGKYNLIDGNHRMEKARRSGIEYIMAYKLSVKQHMLFLTTQKAYIAYIEYWNGKLEDLENRKIVVP